MIKGFHLSLVPNPIFQRIFQSFGNLILTRYGQSIAVRTDHLKSTGHGLMNREG